jgi:FAD-dependent monooxygenase
VLMSTGMAQDDILSKWELPSVNRFRQRIFEKNDGTRPREPWQRISQAIFEKWLKEICDKDPLIDLRYGWKVGSVAESPMEVSLTVNDPTGVKHCFTGAYLAGCDGGSSIVRRSLGIPLDGGPMYVNEESTDCHCYITDTVYQSRPGDTCTFQVTRLEATA